MSYHFRSILGAAGVIFFISGVGRLQCVYFSLALLKKNQKVRISKTAVYRTVACLFQISDSVLSYLSTTLQHAIQIEENRGTTQKSVG